MPGEKEGEYIQLIWESWLPDAYFIKGHIPEKVALAELEREEVLDKLDISCRQGDFVKTKYIAVLGQAMHRYARWSMEPGPEGSSQSLRDYKDPGRGRFKVTMFNVVDWKKELIRELSV